MKLLHAADLHLDSPFRGLSAQQALVRRGELRDIPARLVQLARAEQVDLVLLPGDLFDSQRLTPQGLAALKDALDAMSVPVCIAPGNHDYYHSDSPYAGEWPDNVHIFTTQELTEVSLPVLNCVVHSCAFTAPHRESSPLDGFTAPQDGKLHLLCVHGELAPSGRYAPITLQNLADVQAHYVALGHIHFNSGLRQEGSTYWAYPGCPEGRGFDELGRKGALVVELAHGQASAQFHPLCHRQYRIERVSPAQLPQAMEGWPGEDLVRILLTGESEHAPDLAALTASAAQRFFYAEVRDETTLPQALWAREDEDSLTGLFLREMRRRLHNASPEEQSTLLLATRFGLSALEGGEDIRP